MATESIRIFEDTVLKLSINQGIEPQRSNEKLGDFTMAELAFTRDTGRVFVGDITDRDNGNWQSTVGGSLVGNKYIGFVDSRPLVNFSDNASPLAYTHRTTQTGTFENGVIFEEGVLGPKSKFRIRESYNPIKGTTNPIQDPYNEENQTYANWDRTATYNYKLNAYTGDYFFDIYQNALVLVDHRIKKDYDQVVEGREHQTFLTDDGTEVDVVADTEKAINIQRRTPIQNYVHPNADSTNSNKIYGDGYVIMRIVEPDNQTIRFKPRDFGLNGLPTDGSNNYNHNLLEVFNVPFNAISEHFSDDFTISDKVYINKEIENVDSITSSGVGLKVPNTLIFSTSLGDGERGSEANMSLNFTKPQDGAFPSNSYEVRLVPSQDRLDPKTGKTYPVFDVVCRPAEEGEENNIVQDYYFNLDGGLQSNQENPNMLRLDATATDPAKAPTLTLNLSNEDSKSGYGSHLADGEKDPFGNGKASYTTYSSNFGLNDDGTVSLIDEYENSFYRENANIIDKFEERNTSINYLRTPVTIMSTSHNESLYAALNGGEYIENANGVSFAAITTPTATKTSSADYKDLDRILMYINDLNSVRCGMNGPTNNTGNFYVTKSNNYSVTISLLDWSKSGGSWVSVASPALPNNIEIEKVILSATISDLTETSNTEKFTGFVAIKNGKDVVKLETFEQYYSNFSFTFSFNLSEVLVKGTSYIVVGIINSDFPTSYKFTIDKLTYTSRTLNAEQQFQVKKAGINAYLDFVSEPYLYCSRKAVSSPDTNILPKAPSVTSWPGGKLDSNKTAITNYINSINDNDTYSKTWNNMVTVLGHNHSLNVIQEDSQVPVVSNSIFKPKTNNIYTIKKKVFKRLRDFEVDSTTYAKVNHTLAGVDASKVIFSWWEKYQKTGTAKNNDTVRYSLDVGSDVRSSSKIYDEGDDIDFVYVGDSTTQLINKGTANGVVESKEMDFGNGWYGIQRAIFAESSLLSGTVSYITYGRKSGTRIIHEINKDGSITVTKTSQSGWEQVFDLYKYAGLSFNYKVTGYLQSGDGSFGPDEITDFAILNSNFQKVNVNVTLNSLKTFLKNGLTIDTPIVSGSNSTFGNTSTWCYLVLVYDDPSTTAIKERYVNVYQVIDYQYVGGMFEPKTIPNARISENTNKVTVNEVITDANKVYIPKHARSVILEMTHLTSVNNIVGVFYSNEFEDLGVVLSGYNTEEYITSPNTFTNELTVNPWYKYPNRVQNYEYSGYNSSGVLQLPKTKALTYKFHNDAIKNNTNASTVPSIYSEAPNEKCLCISPMTETRILEVPFHRSNNSGVRHFSLRLANLRPATKESVNYFCLKVIGYRV